LLIRLPKRGDEEGEAGAEGDGDVDGAAVEGEVEVGEGTDAADADRESQQPEEPKEKEKEKEEPIGGGKPFRTIQGKVYVIDGDEFVTEDDPKGDEKIDKSGVLLGGIIAVSC
jgi:chromatin structure-remodeling complex protein RSC7